ncbi:SPOR domain-containing protein [Vicingus serpentipes]|uniref:SPOR domain-containing protein n=1 Tax=Vicingus serpentipes TaxID=1926625 RepID=A0A5C6RQF4_9FLAO|nr:SPOR domain-containing protein [Vicingus serpentipes]TXB64571.1 SPOR domain-containing protein [Vicingus serpentipes]
MVYKIKLLFWILFLVQFSFAQDLSLENKILKSEAGIYHITTKVSGKGSGGILRLKFTIPDEYTFKLFNEPALLIDKRGNEVKFYAQFDGEIDVDINYQLTKSNNDVGEAILPVFLEYTVNEEMKKVNKEIVLSNHTFVEESVIDSVSTHLEEASIIEQDVKEEITTAAIEDLNQPEIIKEENKKEEETLAMPQGYNSSTNMGLDENTKTYSVQILSLQFFNEARFKEFLAEYKLNSNDTYKKEINGVIKIYIGKFKSYDEAKAVKQKLIEENNLTDSFVVSY